MIDEAALQLVRRLLDRLAGSARARSRCRRSRDRASGRYRHILRRAGALCHGAPGALAARIVAVRDPQRRRIDVAQARRVASPPSCRARPTRPASPVDPSRRAIVAVDAVRGDHHRRLETPAVARRRARRASRPSRPARCPRRSTSSAPASTASDTSSSSNSTRRIIKSRRLVRLDDRRLAARPSRCSRDTVCVAMRPSSCSRYGNASGPGG